MTPIDLPVAKVRVQADGLITLDGRVVEIERLRTAFLELKAKGGQVWYYREAGESEPHPNAMAVMQAIVDANLPVSLSSREDFSTVVLPDGTKSPR